LAQEVNDQITENNDLSDRKLVAGPGFEYNPLTSKKFHKVATMQNYYKWQKQKLG